MKKDLTNQYRKLNKENQELKEQLETKETQQKEFIELLELMYKETQDIWYIKILNKYKEIIGKDINVATKEM